MPQPVQATVEVTYGEVFYGADQRYQFSFSLWADQNGTLSEVLLTFDTAAELRAFGERHGLTLELDADAQDAEENPDDPDDD